MLTYNIGYTSPLVQPFSDGLVRFAPCTRLVTYGRFAENCHFSRHGRRRDYSIYFFYREQRNSAAFQRQPLY